MAGWALVWSRSKPDNARWSKTLSAAARYGGDLTEFHDHDLSLATWRRRSGEFPASGVLVAQHDAHVAWLGQCVEDGAEASAGAIVEVAAERFDAAAVSRLNGAFATAVVRRNPFEVRLVTDRHRHYPVYLHRGRDVVVASTELRCIVPWQDRPELEPDAVDMLLRCGELIDRLTLLKGVEMLPPGSVWSLCDGGARERRYWSMRSDGTRSLASAAQDLADTLKAGVRRLEGVSPRLGITLSGGLDSRIILDLCEHPEAVPSYTWGLPGCRDIVCASEFASLVGSRHEVKHWDPPAFPPLWSRGVDLTSGNCGIESMFMLPFVPLLGSACDVVFNGLAGDVALGGNWLKHAWLAEPSIESLARSVWRWRVPESHDQLVDRMTGRSASASSACNRWVASLAQREGARPVERLNDWLLENRIFRTTNCGTMLLRGGVESHAPFFDRDFIDVLAQARQEHKFKHRLYLEVMNRAAPRSASVTWQRTNVKPSRGYYANLGAMAYQKAITKMCKPFGITPFGDNQVADPAGWMRGPWRTAIEEVVLGSRALQRGLLNPDIVRQTWSEHLAGVDHTRQVSVLVAVELFARLTVDGEAQ